MLQQTQIATMLPFYQRFIDRFPSVGHLARAREAEVLAQWSGLGYYRRARHLLAAARSVMSRHAGRIPRDEAAFGRLPGVGRYTRGAVLSIAFGLSLPALDGNVARVLSRLWAVPHSARDRRGSKALWELATALVPMRSPGDWNQALMELGATVCTPRSPRCAVCPVRGACLAFARDAVGRFPPAPKRAAVTRARRAVAMLERRGRWLLMRRPGPILEGLWEPPSVALRARDAGRARAAPTGAARSRRPQAARTSAASRLAPSPRPPAALKAELERLGVRATLAPTRQLVRHRIMNSEFQVEVWIAGASVARARSGSGEHGARRAAAAVVGARSRDALRASAAPARGSSLGDRSPVPRETLRWVDLGDPDVPITGLTRKLARILEAPAPPRRRADRVRGLRARE